MTDFDAMRARHVRGQAQDFRVHVYYCAECGMPWGDYGCDFIVADDHYRRLEGAVREAMGYLDMVRPSGYHVEQAHAVLRKATGAADRLLRRFGPGSEREFCDHDDLSEQQCDDDNLWAIYEGSVLTGYVCEVHKAAYEATTVRVTT